jgi:hypothetical protein
MKKAGLLVLAAILCTTPFSLCWSSKEMFPVSVGKANAQNKVGVNRRPVRPLYGPNAHFYRNPYVNYGYFNPYVNHGNRNVNPYVNRR